MVHCVEVLPADYHNIMERLRLHSPTSDIHIIAAAASN